jgi:peroxiredoxin
LQIRLNTSTMRLEELPLDVGYASEKVTLKDINGTEHVIGGQNGKTQLIVTAPFIDDSFVSELDAIEDALPSGGEHEVVAALVVAGEAHKDPELKRFQYLLDSEGEFADWYGVRLSGDPCDGELTKALFVISKDGALFYDEFVPDLHDAFNAETAIRKIYAAQECYTGKGCH